MQARTVFFVLKEHCCHGRRALQMGDAVLEHQSARALSALRFADHGGDAGRLLCLDRSNHLCKRHQCVQGGVAFDAKVHQTGNFVHPDRGQLIDARDGILNCAEQAAVIEVAQECEIDDRIHLFVADATKIQVDCALHTLRFPECRKRPSVVLDQARRALQIALHRLARLFADHVAITADERMKHQRDFVLRRVAAEAPEFIAIGSDLFGDLLDRLAEQMGQHVGSVPGGLYERVDVARGRDPKGQCCLNRTRLGYNLNARSVGRREGDFIAAPKFAHRIDVAKHCGLVRWWRVFRTQEEVFWHPA